jgi:hypothetical protein
MVRSGFHLGCANSNRMFRLTFTLFNPEMAEREADLTAGSAIADDCRPGEQVRGAGVR